jgi:hypothetical protein
MTEIEIGEYASSRSCHYYYVESVYALSKL